MKARHCLPIDPNLNQFLLIERPRLDLDFSNCCNEKRRFSPISSFGRPLSLRLHRRLHVPPPAVAPNGPTRLNTKGASWGEKKMLCLLTLSCGSGRRCRAEASWKRQSTGSQSFLQRSLEGKLLVRHNRKRSDRNHAPKSHVMSFAAQICLADI